MDLIMKNGTRILRPDEYDQLREGIIRRKPQKQTILDFLLLTGMRYIEAVRFWENENNPDKDSWLMGNSRSIHLPREASRKKKRTMQERHVRLTREGVAIAQAFILGDKPPAIQTWISNLIHWAKNADLDPRGVGAKTTRKTWESWAATAYPGFFPQIMLSQGHTSMTAINHYLGLPFSQNEIYQIRERVAGLFMESG